MKDGDKCEICSVVYGTESIVMYKPVGRSDFRLHRNMKGVRNADSCPVCGYPSGVTGNPKTHAFCHLCKVTFMQRRNTVVLTGLGKFTDTPHWFVGVIEINPED
jgi:ribosomal protein S14